MAMQNLDKVAGSFGCFHVSSADGAVSGKKYYAIVVQEDTVFSEIEIDGADAMSLLNLTGKTLKSGAYIAAYEGTVITKVSLASGSIIAYNKY